MPFAGGDLRQGLVIDDYFAISREARTTPAEQSLAASCFSKSQRVYDEYGILGFPAKDVKGETRAKIIGAEINSSKRAGQKGVATLGSPSMQEVVA